MPNVQADPEEIKKFAHMLKAFNEDLVNNKKHLLAKLKNLNWDDDQHKNFVQEFETLLQILDQFVQASNPYIPFLQKKAQKLREYLELQ
jgi:hypothetical protein